jgi:hypothetical protein
VILLSKVLKYTKKINENRQIGLSYSYNVNIHETLHVSHHMISLPVNMLQDF